MGSVGRSLCFHHAVGNHSLSLLEQMYAIARHGTRYATAKRHAETKNIEATILRKLGPTFAKKVHSYRSSEPVYHGDLTHLGMKEQFCLALRLKTALPTLLGVPYSNNYYSFRSSQTSRSFKRYRCKDNKLCSAVLLTTLQ